MKKLPMHLSDIVLLVFITLGWIAAGILLWRVSPW